MSDRKIVDDLEDWLLSRDGPRPVRGRCQWPVIGRWFHVWGPWSLSHPGSIFQHRDCTVCRERQEKGVASW